MHNQILSFNIQISNIKYSPLINPYKNYSADCKKLELFKKLLILMLL